VARVCMVAYTDYIGDTRIRREAEALVERGDSVDLICPWTESLHGQTSYGGVQLHFARKFSYSGGTGPLSYLTRYLAFLFAAAIRVRRLHRRRAFDVVQVHTMPDFLVFAALPAKRRGAKVVLDIHDLVPELYASKFGVAESHPLIRTLVWLERRSVAFADAALAVHDPHRDALVHHGNPPEKLTVIMNAPDLKLLGPPREAEEIDPLLVVYHGTISKRHGLESAVRAVGLARRELPQLSLFVAGDGDDAARIGQLVRELELDNGVRMSQGIVPLEELLPTLRRAGAAVVPLVPDPFTRYMLPVKLLEYASLQIPVLVTRTPTIEAYFGDSAVIYIDPHDPETLSRRLIELIRDPEEGRRLAANAAKIMAQHSWEQERARYYSVIDGLIQDGSSSGEKGEKRLRIEMR
jgi:glycosyltransferase involved in cell wall biosynthesis